MQSTHISPRRYDLDWLRVLTILSVFLYHIGMFFNSSSWHVKNNETTQILTIFMDSFHHWRLPLLVFISGAGTILAAAKRSTKAFVKERNRRLMIPLLFAMLVIVPPQIYLEFIDRYTSYADFYPTVFEFQEYPKGSFSWHHMWFVFYIFFFSMLLIPLLNFLKSDRSKRFISLCERAFSSKYAMFLLVIVPVITQLLLKPYFPKVTHNFTKDWAYIALLICFFIFGMIVASSEKLWQILKERRVLHLKFAIGIHVLFYILYALPWKEYQPYFPINFRSLYDFFGVIIAWTMMLCVVGYGQILLNRPHKHLPALNEAIYPFYILHQTVILVLGYLMLSLSMALVPKMIVLTVASFLVIVALYLLLVRPFNVMRFLFGMKKKKVAKDLKTESVSFLKPEK